MVMEGSASIHLSAGRLEEEPPAESGLIFSRLSSGGNIVICHFTGELQCRGSG